MFFYITRRTQGEVEISVTVSAFFTGCSFGFANRSVVLCVLMEKACIRLRKVNNIETTNQGLKKTWF